MKKPQYLAALLFSNSLNSLAPGSSESSVFFNFLLTSSNSFITSFNPLF